MKKSMHQLMRELEEVRSELKGISLYDRIAGDKRDKYKALEKQENKLMKQLYHL